MSGDWSTATGRKTGSRARRARSFCAPSGWPRPWPGPDSRPEPAPSSNVPPPSSTTSACLLRRSIPSVESSWETSPKPSAISGSSMRPGPFPRRNSNKNHRLKMPPTRRVRRLELRLEGGRPSTRRRRQIQRRRWAWMSGRPKGRKDTMAAASATTAPHDQPKPAGLSRKASTTSARLTPVMRAKS